MLDFLVSEKLKLAANLPKFGVSDNAANMKKGLGSSLLELYLCCCHTQQLAVLETFKQFEADSSTTLLSASDTCKRLSAHLHKSNLAKMLLQEECKEAGHFPKVIPQANETRWDSRYSNMMGVIYHQDCLMRLARKGKLKVKKDKQVVSLIPTMEEMLLIEAGAEVLKVCQDTTKVFEQEARPTLPLVVERLYTMDWLLKEFEHSPNFAVAEFAQALRENIGADNRFPQFGMRNGLNCMANYLNPILLGCHLKLEGGKFEETKSLLAKSFEEWGLAKQLPEEEVNVNQEVDQPEVVKRLTPTELLKQQVRGVRGRGESRMSDIFQGTATLLEEEMTKYEASEDAADDADMLQWWKHHAKEYPRYIILRIHLQLEFSPCNIHSFNYLL